MSDQGLVSDLRAAAGLLDKYHASGEGRTSLMRRAADEIERMRAELDRISWAAFDAYSAYDPHPPTVPSKTAEEVVGVLASIATIAERAQREGGVPT